MAGDIKVQIDESIESETEGVSGNTYKGLYNLSPTFTELHGYLESLGDADGARCRFVVIPQDAFEDGEDPQDPEVWNEKVGSDEAMIFDAETIPIYQENTYFAALAYGLDPEKYYYYKLIAEGVYVYDGELTFDD